MEFFKNLSIRSKLLLLSVIPSLGLLYLLYDSVNESLNLRETARQVYEDCERTESISRLVHELQNERGYYLSFVTSGTDDDREKVLAQQKITDAAIVAIETLYNQHGRTSAVFEQLDMLALSRADTSNHPENLNNIKDLLLDELYGIATVSRNPEIKSRLEAHLFLAYTKEYFSRAKNVLLPFFISEEFPTAEFSRFVERKGQYELSRLQFAMRAPSDVLDLYEKAYDRQVIRRVHATLDSLTTNPTAVRSISPTAWWNESNEVVAALASAETFSLESIRQRAEAEVSRMNTNVIMNVASGVTLLAIVLFIMYYTLRQIVLALSEIKRAAQNLAKGEVDFTLDVRTRDEIGDLVNSFNAMVNVIRGYAETAQAIGRGQYDTAVLVRGESDLLGKALRDMRDDLKRLSEETETRTWLLTGNNQLNDTMRGEKELPVLASDVITQLSEFLKAQIGALYIRENGALRLTGQYAFTMNGRGDTIDVGQGLVGQAAATGRPIFLTDVPDNYLKIRSGLGEMNPKNVIIYPFMYEGEVKGVIEVGAAKEFSPLDIQFLDLVHDHIGIAINATQSRQKLKELLEETQRQSEELEAQQEELKQFNEELVEKTKLLEKSEEELKAQQEELQMSNEELSEKAALLEEQKQNLEYTKLQMETKAKELELASKYKSEFLSNMSHELRTPLNSILILAQVLTENRSRNLTEKEMKFAQTIYNSGNDLLNLINEILDLSKIEAGKMELEVAPFALNLIAQNMSNSFEELARRKKIRFSINCSNALRDSVMTSDQKRIEQVLKNFLANAFKFTSGGGRIDLNISKTPDRNLLNRKSLQQAKEVLAFTVQDNGIGIPEDRLSIIFEAFQQVDGSTKRKYGGTGLGLSISRELATLLGGEIQVSSRVGEGSAFTLYLPSELPASADLRDEGTVTIRPILQPAEIIAGAQEEPLPTDASHYDDQHLITEGDRKILIMEDDVEFSKVLLDFIHERNYKGIIAHQGNVGLSYARHYKPDAIILDMKLPVVDGAEVLKKLKSDPELRHIPVQIISGHDYRKSGLELGAIDFLRKPVSREAFWKALDKVEDFVSRKPKRLLIVEDNKEHNQAVQELIGNGDVMCFAAFSGKEAYKMLTENAFDCIIVDLGLPDMSGFAFLEKIRENAESNRIPVIVYTGKDLSKEENTRLEKLANTVVLKTAFSHERLLDETTLFLHRVEARLPKEKQNIIRKLHKTDEVLKGKRILIVDDDERNVYSLLSALEPEGMICSKAENGKVALEVLQKEGNFDMILMDVMMPEMDGFETTRVIRGMMQFRKTPIIALTAKAMKDDREKCLAAGMSDYISKPLNVQQLLSLMRVWLYA